MGLVKGLTRISMLVLFVVASMFKPEACMFPDGKESWDSAHVCFACYVAERVENVRSSPASGERPQAS